MHFAVKRLGVDDSRQQSRHADRRTTSVRSSRLNKAPARAHKLTQLFSSARAPKLFAVGILRVALYGCEHAPWTLRDRRRLRGCAVTALRLRPPGVPLEQAPRALPAGLDPEWLIHSRPLHRWAREAWSLHIGGPRVGDSLDGRTLQLVHSKFCNGEVTRGPAAALGKRLFSLARNSRNHRNSCCGENS